MITVGIIANPSAGKDIRRLVAAGRVVPDQEKANTLTRVCAGLVAMGVERLLVMPEPVGLARPAAEQHRGALNVDYVDMPRALDGKHSTRAAKAMAADGVACIVTLGGDGTNRVVAMGCGQVPLVPISTGTNNVFPEMVEGTLAGLAAGAVAAGRVRYAEVCTQTKRLEVFVDGELEEIALIDAAVSSEMFAGARAIWNVNTISEVFLARAEASAIGISSIGAQLRQIGPADGHGLHLTLGEGDGSTEVLAPVGPGQVHRVSVAEWSVMEPGERHTVELRPGMVALDGEREVSLLPGRTVEVGLSLEGPRVVDISATLAALARNSSPSGQVSSG